MAKVDLRYTDTEKTYNVSLKSGFYNVREYMKRGVTIFDIKKDLSHKEYNDVINSILKFEDKKKNKFVVFFKEIIQSVKNSCFSIGLTIFPMFAFLMIYEAYLRRLVPVWNILLGCFVLIVFTIELIRLVSLRYKNNG